MNHVLEIGNCAAGGCGRLFAQRGCDVVRVEIDGGEHSPAFTASACVSDEAMAVHLHLGSRLGAVLTDAHLAEWNMWQQVYALDGSTPRSSRPPWRVQEEHWLELALPVPKAGWLSAGRG